MQSPSKQWLVVYTKPNWEKKVHSLLLKQQIESWCPLQKIEKQWSDRKKIIEIPLFKSYVFVRISKEEYLKVFKTEGVLHFVMYLGKPAVVKESEINLIKKFIVEAAQITLQPIETLQPNTLVKIKYGIFMDNTGMVVKNNNKKVYVQLKSLGKVMIVQFPANYLSKEDNELLHF